MAILVTLEFPGMSTEQFRSQAQQVGTATQLAPGQIFRVAGPIAGGWRVVAAFESPEVFQTYLQERLQPVFQREGTPPTRIETWPLADMRIGS